MQYVSFIKFEMATSKWCLHQRNSSILVQDALNTPFNGGYARTICLRTFLTKCTSQYYMRLIIFQNSAYTRKYQMFICSKCSPWTFFSPHPNLEKKILVTFLHFLDTEELRQHVYMHNAPWTPQIRSGEVGLYGF